MLVLQWGRSAIESLRAGDVIALRVLEDDAFVTLSRVTAVHKEGNNRGERIVGGDVWLMTKGDGMNLDERKLRLADSSDQYIFGRDETAPGRVWMKIPYLGKKENLSTFLLFSPYLCAKGYPALVFGDVSVALFLVIAAYIVFALVQAGRAAKKARQALAAKKAKRTIY